MHYNKVQFITLVTFFQNCDTVSVIPLVSTGGSQLRMCFRSVLNLIGSRTAGKNKMLNANNKM